MKIKVFSILALVALVAALVFAAAPPPGSYIVPSFFTTNAAKIYGTNGIGVSSNKLSGEYVIDGSGISGGGDQVWTNELGIIHPLVTSNRLAIGDSVIPTTGTQLYITNNTTNVTQPILIRTHVGGSSFNQAIKMEVTTNSEDVGTYSSGMWLSTRLRTPTSTGAIYWNDGNYGFISEILAVNQPVVDSIAVPEGQEIAIYGFAHDITFRNMGVVGYAKEGLTNIGVVGVARKVSDDYKNVGGYFETVSTQSDPLFPESAALIADNRDTGYKIFIGRNNQVEVFAIDGTGFVSMLGFTNFGAAFFAGGQTRFYDDLFVMGGGVDKFKISAIDGNIEIIRGVSDYLWPTIHAGGALTNNGTGELGWFNLFLTPEATNTLASSGRAELNSASNSLVTQISAKQNGSAKLTNFSNLADGTGALTNNGSGTYGWFNSFLTSASLTAYQFGSFILSNLAAGTYNFTNTTTYSSHATNVNVIISQIANPTTNAFELKTSTGNLSYFIRSNGNLRVPMGSSSIAAIGNTNRDDTGIYFGSTTTVDIMGAGTTAAEFSNGGIDLGGNQIAWGSGIGSRDIVMIRLAAGRLRLSNFTTPLTNEVYGTYTSITSGEKLEMGYRGDLATFFIDSNTNGAGTLRPLAIGVTTNYSISIDVTRGVTVTAAQTNRAVVNITTGGLILGANGGTYTNLLAGSATLDFPSTLAQTDSDLSITVTGAAVGDEVFLGAPMPLTGSTYTAFASNDVVWVRFSVYGLASKDPASGTFRVSCMKR